MDSKRSVGSPSPARAFGLVIFDCDGVLIDSETISCSTVASILARHGVPTDMPEVLARFLGRSANAVTDHYVRTAKRPLPLYFVEEWRTQLFEAFARNLTPIEGAREAIEALGIRYCLASSSDEARIELTLRKTALWDLFEGRIFSATMVANAKPAPDVFLLAAAAANVAPERCLVVEDSVTGITAAKAAGMTAYGFTAGSHFDITDQTQELLRAGADRIIGSMKELQARLAN